MVRISSRDSTNEVELFKYISGEVMQRFHSGGDVYITVSNGTTVGHVGTGEDMTTLCNQEEADTRIILHIIHALNCGLSSILIKTPDSDVIVILIHHLQHVDTISTGCNITVNYGIGKTQRVINIRERACALGVQRSATLPLFVTLTGCDSTSAMNGRSKRMCLSAWKKCSPRVTECMMELLDSTFQPLQMGAKFDALEELFIQIYCGGQASSINQVRKTIFCQRNKNIEMITPSQNTLFQHSQRAMFQESVWTTAHDSAMIEPDPCLRGWNREHDHLIPQWITIPEVAAMCKELVKCGCKKSCSGVCSCRKHALTCTALCKCQCLKA